jgi:TetR/AcrR family fatty acid metabolism transcriptional regulator
MNKRERSELIVESAKKLFVERGFHNTSVSDIIAEAKIVRSTFYAHFAGKMDIFRILVDRFSEILLDSILSINISRAEKEQNLSGQIMAMTAGLIDAIEKNRDLTLLLITAPLGHDNKFDHSVSEFFSKILGAIRQLLVEGIEGGTIRRLDPDIISYVILGSVKQILLQWLIYRDISDISAALGDIVEYTLFGIAERR